MKKDKIQIRIIIGGYTGTGKSTFASSIANLCMKHGINMIYNKKMPDDDKYLEQKFLSLKKKGTTVEIKEVQFNKDVLEKVEKVQELNMEVNKLEFEIREEQKKCKHEYPDKPLFDTESFYCRCIKCNHEKVVEHNVDISTNEIYERNKIVLQKNWDILILNE